MDASRRYPGLREGRGHEVKIRLNIVRKPLKRTAERKIPSPSPTRLHRDKILEDVSEEL